MTNPQAKIGPKSKKTTKNVASGGEGELKGPPSNPQPVSIWNIGPARGASQVTEGARPRFKVPDIFSGYEVSSYRDPLSIR